jgi:N-methylhydantoinase A/oxoprolinase/acetone carboxylase beta subunit
VLRFAADTPPTTDSLDFFTLVQRDHRKRLDGREIAILDALADGPKSRLELTRRLNYMAPSLLRTERLEALGYIRRSAFTPTDVLHTTGEFVAWDRKAAETALDIFARILGQPAAQAAERVRREVVRRLTMEIMRRLVSLSADSASLDTCTVCRLFLDNLFEGTRREEFAFRFDVSRPVVAIGAPAGVYMPEVGRLLSAKVIVPEHADVANAIGAITSKIIVSEIATIQPSESGDYIVHTSVERREFEDLASARAYAERLVTDLVRRKAPLYGTNESDIRLEVSERAGTLAKGESVFLEMTIAAAIAGKPAITG